MCYKIICNANTTILVTMGGMMDIVSFSCGIGSWNTIGIRNTSFYAFMLDLDMYRRNIILDGLYLIK